MRGLRRGRAGALLFYGSKDAPRLMGWGIARLGEECVSLYTSGSTRAICQAGWVQNLHRVAARGISERHWEQVLVVIPAAVALPKRAMA